MRLAVPMVILATILAACAAPARGPGEVGSRATQAEAPSAPEEEQGDGPSNLEGPPPLLVRAADQELSVPASTYCWAPAGVCADGFPTPEAYPIRAAGNQVLLEVPLRDWLLDISVVLPRECEPFVKPDPEVLGEGRWRLVIPAPAGTYDVHIFAKGAGGDAFYAFEATTSTDGPVPVPKVLLPWEPGAPVTLTVENLSEAPEDTSAEVAVQQIVFKLEDVPDERGCFPGNLALGPHEDHAYPAAALGDPPYRFQVTLRLGDRTHELPMATWPEDFSSTELLGGPPTARWDLPSTLTNRTAPQAGPVSTVGSDQAAALFATVG